MFTRKAHVPMHSIGPLVHRHFGIPTRTKRINVNDDQSLEAQESATVSDLFKGLNEKFYIKQLNEEWRSAVAGEIFQKDDVIGSSPGVVYPEPTRFTVQMTPEKHVHMSGGLKFVNHSCEPNTRIDLVETEALVSFVAIKPIHKGEYLSFDYATSEWDMDEKFACQCGSPKCRKDIRGAKFLTDEQVIACMPYFTSSVLRQLLTRKLLA